MAMAKNTTTKVTPATKDELHASLVKIQTELVEAKRTHASKELANTRKISDLRRSIARTKTALSSLKRQEEKKS